MNWVGHLALAIRLAFIGYNVWTIRGCIEHGDPVFAGVFGAFLLYWYWRIASTMQYRPKLDILNT